MAKEEKMTAVSGNDPLTLDDFILTMNAILIEIYTDVDSKTAGDKLTSLANRLHEMALGIDNPTRAAIIGGLSTALMMTENGG